MATRRTRAAARRPSGHGSGIALASDGVTARPSDGSDESVDLVRQLLDELEETNEAVLSLTIELDARVEERTRALHEAQVELQQTNSELLQLTLELQDRVAERTAELQAANASLRASERTAVEAARAAEAARARAVEANVLLRASEEKYRLVTENAADVIWTLDLRASRFTYVSPSVQRLRDYAPEEVMDRPVADAFTPDSLRALQACVLRTLPGFLAGDEGSRSSSLELEQPRRDGSIVTTEVVATYLRDDAGDATVLLGISRDITERRRVEEALRDRAARDGLLVDQSADAIFRVLPPHGRFVDANPAACDLFGYDRDEMLEVDAADLVVADAAGEAASWPTGVEGDGTSEVELSMRRKDGGHMLVAARIRALPDGSLLAVAHDVTTERARAARASEAQRMEAVGRLAGGVAHDFNNLLMVVSGHAEVLESELDEDDPRREGIEAIREAGDRAAALIRQLLAFSRRQVLKPVVLDVDTIVTDLGPMLARLVGEDVDVVLVAGAVGGHVLVDRSQLEQVVMNLVVNARDAMPGGGRLTIETTLTEVAAGDPHLRQQAMPGPYVRLSVTDTGVGMDAETMARIFEPFFTTKPATRGTGLGLATVDGIVGQSSGFVSVTSEPGVGSCFSVHLPLASGEVPGVAEATPSPPATGRETILLVEDGGAVRRIASRILRDLGYAVVEAVDGQAALERIAADGSIALVVTDVVMPGMSGPDLVARIAEVRPGIPTLYISGYAPDTILHAEDLRSGVAFIAKPFRKAELGLRVRSLLDGDPAAPTA